MTPPTAPSSTKSRRRASAKAPQTVPPPLRALPVPRHAPCAAARIDPYDPPPAVHPGQEVLALIIPGVDPFSAYPYDVRDEFGGAQAELETRLLAPNSAASSGGGASGREPDAPQEEHLPDPQENGPDSAVRVGVTWGVTGEPPDPEPGSTGGTTGTGTADAARTTGTGPADATRTTGTTRTPGPARRTTGPAGRTASDGGPVSGSATAGSRRAANTTGARLRSGIPNAANDSGLLPEPRPWAAAFIQAAMEVACGLRPSTQLIRWTTPDVHGALVRRGALTARAMRNSSGLSVKPRLRALVLCSPRPGVCEVSAVIAEPQRVRAVAFRMEGLHGRWRVTELQMQGRLES